MSRGGGGGRGGGSRGGGFSKSASRAMSRLRGLKAPSSRSARVAERSARSLDRIKANYRLNPGQRAVFNKAEAHINSYSTRIANGERPNWNSFSKHLEKNGVGKREQQSIGDSLKDFFDNIKRGVDEGKRISNDDEDDF